MNQFTISSEAAGERLDVLVAAVTNLPRSQAQRRIKAGFITVNSKSSKASYITMAADIIIIDAPPAEVVPPVTIPDLRIVYMDEDLLVIDKPAGLTVHAGTGTAGQATVADFARLYSSDPDTERPGIVHRLDRDTSGLMIIARHVGAKTFLQDQFRHHNVTKTYRLMAFGRVEPDEAIIKLPIGRDPARPLRRAINTHGRPASTSYRTLESLPGYTYLEAQPKTGRTHQLRVHFAAIGHPIAGDITYGSPGADEKRLGLTRQFLHAYKLEFTGPAGQAISLTSPLPPDLDRALQSIRDRV